MIYRITLVNHTRATERLQSAIQSNLQDLFRQAFAPVPDDATVSWGQGAATDAIVIHIVDDVASSYLQQQWPGNDIRGDAGGHTCTRGHVTGSEVYLHVVMGGRRTMNQDRRMPGLRFTRRFTINGRAGRTVICMQREAWRHLRRRSLSAQTSLS